MRLFTRAVPACEPPAPAPQTRIELHHHHQQAARLWVEALSDGDHVYADLRAACESAIGVAISDRVLPPLLVAAGFRKHRVGRPKITCYRRGKASRPRAPKRSHLTPRTAPLADSEAAPLFGRWTLQIRAGVYAFSTLRDSFAEWCVDGHVDLVPDPILAAWLKQSGYVRYRVGRHKLTIYEKPAATQKLAA